LGETPELAIPESPALLADSANLWLAYFTTAEPRGQVCAVVRFRGVIDHQLSPINDEGLGMHACAPAGLKWYVFNEVIDSAQTIQWKALKGRHWVVTFKDNTLDVIAAHVEVIASAIQAANPVAALLSVMKEDRSLPQHGG
jgi:hypothetical protein